MARGQLPRAYLRIDPNLDQHADPDGMVRLICAANRQLPRGRFATREVLRWILGSRKRVDEFINPRQPGKRPDLVAQPDGSFYLDGWDEWNEGDLTVGDRMRRIREKRGYSRNKAVTTPSIERIADRNSPSEASRRLGVKAEKTPSSPAEANEFRPLICPGCGCADTLMRERANARNDHGWWCVLRRGGCGGQYALGDPRILGGLSANVRRSVEADLRERHGGPTHPADEATAVAVNEVKAFIERAGSPKQLAMDLCEFIRANHERMTPKEAREAWYTQMGVPIGVRIEVERYRSSLEVEHGTRAEHATDGAPGSPAEARGDAVRVHPPAVAGAARGGSSSHDAGSADAVQRTGGK